MRPLIRKASVRATRVDAALLRNWPLPVLKGTLGKEERGTLLVVGGSREVPGATLLAGISGLRAGTGTLQIATVSSVSRHLALVLPESKVIGLSESRGGEILARGCRALYNHLDDCDAIVIGPGMSKPAAGVALVRHCLAEDLSATLVVDAAPLCEMSFLENRTKRFRGGIILTPHAGEMARLWNISRERVLARPLEIALETSVRLGAVVMVKGPKTWIASPDGKAYCDASGNVGLGTSGSGDVLAGAVGGLAARGASPLQAAVWGAHLHGLAGEALAQRVGPLGYLAREIADELPGLLGPRSQPSKSTAS